MGHIQRVCKNKAAQQAQTTQVAEQREDEHEELFVAIHVDSALAVHQSTDLWLIDSGCSNHMSPNLDIFKCLDESCTSKVRIGNGDLLAAHGKGTAMIQTISGTKQIDNVLYVPEIAHNLLIVEQLVDTSFSLLFDYGKCVVKDCNDSLLIIVEMKNRNFPLYISESSYFAYTSVVDQSNLMHRRLGHFSYSILSVISYPNQIMIFY